MPTTLTELPRYDFSFLRELRKRDTLTIGDVSARCGISSAVISKLERNQTSATLETLFRLSRVFGMTTTELIALAESRTAQIATAERHHAGGFMFQGVRYGNIRVLYGSAPRGARLSRPEAHRDDYEICMILAGSLTLVLPDEKHDLAAGQAIQFDAILLHTYQVIEDCRLVIIHLRKDKRF